MKNKLLIFACIASLLASCSSNKLSYRFVPKNDQNLLWRNGESGISDTGANIYCTVNSPRVINEKLQFNMYFHNEGDEMVLIDPSTFYVHQTLKVGNIKGAFAYTPEQLLVEYNQQVSSRNGFIIFAAVAAVVVGAAIVASSTKNKKTDNEQQYDHTENRKQLNRIERNQREQIELERLRQQQQPLSKPTEPDENSDRDAINSMQQHMLRKHSLLPNESISGLVVFPMLYDVNKVDLFVPIQDSTKLKFSYDMFLK